MHLRRLVFPVGVAVVLLATAACAQKRKDAPKPVPKAEVKQQAKANEPVQLMITGHSLTDRPIPEYLEHIATAAGHKLEWQRQMGLGSTLKWRARQGEAPPEKEWRGYREGFNRGETKGLDIVAEIRNPKTVSGPYDIAIVAEGHNIMRHARWNQTVEYLRHLHDLMAEVQPDVVTWSYHGWLGLKDAADPKEFLAFNAAEVPVWECITTRTNETLAAEGRPQNVRDLPMSHAIGVLVEHLVQNRIRGLPESAKERIALFVYDPPPSTNPVHITNLGKYYAALVTYGFVFGQSPVGTQAPPGLEAKAETLEDLRKLAAEVVEGYAAKRKAEGPRTMKWCSQYTAALCEQHHAFIEGPNPHQIKACQRYYGGDESPFSKPFVALPRVP